MDFISIKNNQRILVSQIPELNYQQFYNVVVNELLPPSTAHCVNYFAIPANGHFKLFCCIANDSDTAIHVLSTVVNNSEKLSSITARYLAFHPFEREMHEQFGLNFDGHPWLKPLRYPFNKANKENHIGNYPFYTIDSEELHEVGVGPIHAGVIEPGHFRFICNGEQILHLEIQLGYQHRGIEQLFIEKKGILQRATLAENIAGDTVIGHSVAYAHVWESLCDFEPSKKLEFDRALALEHERVAIHTGDLSAICGDIAYQLGNSVFGRLRTPIINYFQQWSGNRFAKGLIRPGKTNYPFTHELAGKWFEVIDAYTPHFVEMAERMFDMPSVLARLEKTGVVSTQTAFEIGAVGMAARASNLNRDIRASHPFGYYTGLNYQPVLYATGDVDARSRLRYNEVMKSLIMMTDMIYAMPEHPEQEYKMENTQPDSFVLSLVEGWRGEICHCAITNQKGELAHYKIKDPSLHNWLALAMAVRNNEISDFPVCNKSFNLSYCGHDL